MHNFDAPQVLGLIFAIAIAIAIAITISSPSPLKGVREGKQKSLSFQIGFSKTRGVSRTGEAKATNRARRANTSFR